MGCVLLAQVSHVLAQGPDTASTMDLFEFLGSWNDGEGNDIDPMLLDTLTDLDHPIHDQKEVGPYFEGREGNVEEYGEDSQVDHDTQGHNDD